MKSPDVLVAGMGFAGSAVARVLADRGLSQMRESRPECRTSEDVVLAGVGRDLCEKFYRRHTRKQWGLDLSELAPAVAARIGVRSNDDDRYFEERFQCMPADGYTMTFTRMLDHQLISYETSVDGIDARQRIDARHMVYTGPDRCLVRALPWRAALPVAGVRSRAPAAVTRFQPVATVNYPNDHAYTRITEFKQLTGQVHPGTSIVREYPRAEGEPFYPIPRPDNQALFQRYRMLADRQPDVTFVGRLAQYRYYNVDQAVAAAMTAATRVIECLAAR